MSVGAKGRSSSSGLVAEGRVVARGRASAARSLLPYLGSRKKFVALLLAGTVLAVVAMTLFASDGSYANQDREGGSCSGCHDGAQTPAMLSVSGLPVGSYTPSQQYTIVVTVVDSNGGTGENNFDIIANSGSFSTTDPNAEVNTPSTGAEASANDAVSPMTATTWTVVWTAPSSGDAQIDIWAVMGDGAGGSNDIWDHETYNYSVIPEFSVLLVPVIGVVVAIVFASRAMKK